MSGYPERRQFIVHNKMYCVTKEELAKEIPEEDVPEVWESLKLSPCITCEFKLSTGRCAAFDPFSKPEREN